MLAYISTNSVCSNSVSSTRFIQRPPFLVTLYILYIYNLYGTQKGAYH